MTPYPLIDLFKIIASFLVLIIHFRPFQQISENLDFVSAQVISRVAVPFFLITSGYFLAQKGCDSKNIKSTALKLLKLYFFWSLVYLPFTFLWTNYNQTSLSHDLIYILRDIVFQGTVIHLWYLPASALGLYLLNLGLKKFKLNTVLMFSFALYLIGLLADGYYGLIPKGVLKDLIHLYLTIFASSRNGLFFAFFFITLGVKVYEAKWSDRLSEDQIGFGIIGSAVLMFLEIIGLQLTFKPYDYNMFLSLIPMSVFLLLLGLTTELYTERDYLKLRKLSSLVYFSHMWVFYAIVVLADTLKLFGFIENFILRYILIAGLTLALSLFMIHRKEQGGKWVKHFF